jgi:ADP-heptose:LPS heptosyltransferase
MSVLTANRILVYRLGHLGDTLIALPSLAAIRKTFPNAHISLLSNFFSPAERVSPDHVIPDGLIDEWLTYESGDSGSKPLEMLRLLVRLRRQRFDTLAYLAPRIRPERDVRRDLFFFRSAGIKQFLGERGFEALPARGANGLPSVAHEADHLLRRLSLSGIQVAEPGNARFDLELTESEQLEADGWLQRHVPSYFMSSCIVGFAPGSKWPSKVWPEERFVEVGRRLIESENIFPIVFGGAEDRPLGERLISQWGRGANAAGQLSVRLAAAALSHCKLYVGNDTGTMHLAAAVDTKCVVLMSALDWPGHWNPYGDGHRVLRRSVPCEGCLLQVCDKEGLRCLKEISVEDVIDACCQLLVYMRHEATNKTPANSFARQGF